MDKNNTNNNQNYDLTSDHTADNEEATTPSRTTIIWNRVLKITLLVDLVLILIVGSYCLYKYIGGDEIVPPAADLEYNPQPFNKELAKEVLDYQDPNPLMSAIVTDQPLAAIQKILDSGIDVNTQDATGNTALHYAIFREDRKLIKLLLNHGADEDIKNNNDQDCIDISYKISPRKKIGVEISPDNYFCLNLISKNELITDPNPNPLMSAIATDQPLTEIQKILDSGIDVNAQDATGNTALHYAIFYNDNNLVELLLKYGADISIKNHQGKSSFHIVYEYANTEIRSLIFNPEDYDDNGIITRAALIKDSVDDSTIALIFCIPFGILAIGNLFALIHRNSNDDNFNNFLNSPLSKLIIDSLKFFFFLFSICLLISCIYLYFIPYPYQFIIANYNTQFPRIGLFIGAALVIRFFYVIRMYASIE